MAKLSNADKFAIQGMVHANKTPKEMAKILHKPESSINSYLERLAESVIKLAENGVPPTLEDTASVADMPEETKIVTEEKPPGVDPIKIAAARDNMFVRKTGAKQNKGVTVLTPNGAVMGDEAAKQATRSRTSKGSLYNIDEQTID